VGFLLEGLSQKGELGRLTQTICADKNTIAVESVKQNFLNLIQKYEVFDLLERAERTCKQALDRKLEHKSIKGSLGELTKKISTSINPVEPFWNNTQKCLRNAKDKYEEAKGITRVSPDGENVDINISQDKLELKMNQYELCFKYAFGSNADDLVTDGKTKSRRDLCSNGEEKKRYISKKFTYKDKEYIYYTDFKGKFLVSFSLPPHPEMENGGNPTWVLDEGEPGSVYTTLYTKLTFSQTATQQ
jgi:hypothetical protein